MTAVDDPPGVPWACYDDLIAAWAATMLGIGAGLDATLEALVGSVFAAHGLGPELVPEAIENLRTLFATSIAVGQYVATIEATKQLLQNVQQLAAAQAQAPLPGDH